MRMPDLGGRRGALSDWITQRWVQATGRPIDLAQHAWLDGPVGDVRVIGPDYFDRLAAREGLNVARGRTGGLIADFRRLDGPSCATAEVAPSVVRFYECTSDFELDLWAEWCGVFRPFGRALALIFSRRLQQLNVPLSSLDTSEGLRSEVLRLVDREGTVKLTAWVREIVSTGRILYAGAYSLCALPGYPGTCVKVVFPLPNGNATVIMKALSAPDGSLTLRSSGRAFGDPGFYFFVRSRPGHGWARYVRTMRETIRVFVDGHGELRAHHELEIWRTAFLRLHYRMRPRGRQAPVSHDS